MKIPKVRVMVNCGPYKGTIGILIGYDRDKYYRILTSEGPLDFKGYCLDGIEKLKGHGRYYLQDLDYGSDEIEMTSKTHKQLSDDRRYYVGKGKGTSLRRRYFDIDINEERYEDLTFMELKRKLRYAVQEGIDFHILLRTYSKGSTSFRSLMTSKDGEYLTYFSGKSRKASKVKRGAIKAIFKEINKRGQ